MNVLDIKTNADLVVHIMQEYPGAFGYVIACHYPEHEDIHSIDLRTAEHSDIEQWATDHWHDVEIVEVTEDEIQDSLEGAALRHLTTPEPTDEQIRENEERGRLLLAQRKEQAA